MLKLCKWDLKVFVTRGQIKLIPQSWIRNWKIYQNILQHSNCCNSDKKLLWLIRTKHFRAIIANCGVVQVDLNSEYGLFSTFFAKFQFISFAPFLHLFQMIAHPLFLVSDGNEPDKWKWIAFYLFCYCSLILKVAIKTRRHFILLYALFKIWALKGHRHTNWFILWFAISQITPKKTVYLLWGGSLFLGLGK